MEHRQMPQGPARALSIVLMAVLCTVLAVVLLRHPGPPSPPPAPAPEESKASAPLTDEQRRAMYRAWPLFEGWPLPQLPSGPPPKNDTSKTPSAPQGQP